MKSQGIDMAGMVQDIFGLDRKEKVSLSGQDILDVSCAGCPEAVKSMCGITIDPERQYEFFVCDINT